MLSLLVPEFFRVKQLFNQVQSENCFAGSNFALYSSQEWCVRLGLEELDDVFFKCLKYIFESKSFELLAIFLGTASFKVKRVHVKFEECFWR